MLKNHHMAYGSYVSSRAKSLNSALILNAIRSGIMTFNWLKCFALKGQNLGSAGIQQADDNLLRV